MQITSIFISYSHKADRRWFEPDPQRPWMEDGLIPWIKAALEGQGVRIWYDSRGVGPGDEFKKLIYSEIDRADIAILIISTSFLISEFINSIELPKIMERAASNKLICIPILAEPCDWQEVEFLRSRIMLPDKLKPLIEHIDSERGWRNVRYDILSAVKRQIKHLHDNSTAVKGNNSINTIEKTTESHGIDMDSTDVKQKSDQGYRASRDPDKTTKIFLFIFLLIAISIIIIIETCHFYQK